MKKKLFAIVVIVTVFISGCSKSVGSNVETATASEESIHATENTVTLTEGKYSTEKMDDSWSEEDFAILLNQNSIESEAAGVTVEGTSATITTEGTYVLSGELENGRIVVNVPDKGKVKLVLNEASISSADSAPIYIVEGSVVITLAEGTENYVEDGAEYVYTDGTTTEPNAAIFSSDDLSFNGTGSLEVKANYNNGIQSKDDLKFIDGTYTVIAANNGLSGKDSVSVKGGTYTITSAGDGIRTTNTEDTTQGYIMIDGGTISIDAGEDGIQAETLLRVNGGAFDIIAGTGSENSVSNANVPAEEIPQGDFTGEKKDGMQGQPPQDMQRENPPRTKESPVTENQAEDSLTADLQTEEVSTKGLKSYVDMILSDGTFDIDAYDDAIHSNQNITISGGSYAIAAGDDGIHADAELTIDNGELAVNRSYEGLEALTITLNGGDVKIYASDDGINAAGADGQSETEDTAASPETGKGMGESGKVEDQGATLEINGGSLYVNSSGDTLDANGDIIMTGGDVELQGPTSGGDGTLDYDGEFLISGGVLCAVGSLGMEQILNESSTQTFVSGTLDTAAEPGDAITVKNAAGEAVLSITSEKSSQWYYFSSSQLQKGEVYTVAVE